MISELVIFSEMFQIPKSTTQDTIDFPIQQMISTSFCIAQRVNICVGFFSVAE